jgi:hypothetical protein
MRIIKHDDHKLWKGVAAGAAGGLAAAWVMNQFQSLFNQEPSGRERAHGAQSQQQGSPNRGVAREFLVPKLGLSKSTSEYPLSTHVYSLASHIVYGLTTELVRRAVRSRAAEF